MNKRAIVIIICAFISCTAFSSKSFAWGNEGHRIVARIAEANLTENTKQKITSLLSKDNKCKAEETLANKLACVSIWADAVRYFPYTETYNWHFVDISLNFNDYDHARDCNEEPEKGDCGISALENLELFLKNSTISPEFAKYSRASALKFIVHIVGDLHQPLHTVREDRGGNDFIVNFVSLNDGKEIGCYNPDKNEEKLTDQEKLHKIWDTCILTPPLKTLSLIEYAENLNKEITAEEKTEFEKGSELDWLLETHQIAINSSYKNLPTPTRKEDGKDYTTIPDDYFEVNHSVVEKQLKRAGIRLAKILNNIFDN